MLSRMARAGIWVGVELDEPKGKSDGEVKGKRLFTCPPMHGSVLRRSALSVVAKVGATSKVTVSDLDAEFRGLVASRATAQPRDCAARVDVLNAKSSNTANGLEVNTMHDIWRRPILIWHFGRHGPHNRSWADGAHDSETGSGSEVV